MSILQGVPGLAARIEASTGVLDRLAMEIAEHGEAAAAADYAEHWRGINDTAEAANMGGLSEVTEFIWFNAQRLVDACRDGSFEPEQVETLHGVVPMLQVFLAAPLDADGLGNLVCYLQQSGWPVPMGENQAYTVMGRLLEQLQEDEDAPAAAEQAVTGATGQPFTDDEASGEAVPGIGEPEDAGPAQEEDSGDEDEYRLGLPEDVHPQLADAFFNEVPQLAEQFSDHVQHLADGGDRDDLLRAQRLAHTIKGSSNVTGVPAVATLMHACEDLLESLYERQAQPDRRLAEVLIESADCLAAQLDYLQGAGPAPGQTAALVDTLRTWQIGAGDEPGPAVSPEPSAFADADVPEPARQPAEQGTPESMRVSTALIEELLRQAGEVSISTVQLQGLGQSLGERVETLMKQQALMWERLNSIQELVEMRSLSSARTLAAAQSGVEPVFDSLEMDEYNELHSATSFLAESIMDTREYTSGIRDELAQLKAMLKQQDVLSRELNETVMGTRMVPFRSLVPRLKRVVRQTARATGKSVDLEVQGEEVLVDSAVLNRLADPLMHMLRNAIDHGIESAGERAGAGKPAEGRVEVRVERHGDNVSLLVRDDGRGLDYERIRRTGLDKGLVRGDPSAMSEQELARLILVPGFSTRGEANQISGRGIGMDVVNSVVMEQRGTLDVESEPGRGMSVMIRVPMTLISVHTLLVRNAGVVLGIPSSSVQQLIFSDLGEWQRRDGEVFFEFEEREYRVVPLSRLVGLDPAMPEIDGAKPVPLLLVQGEREASAVILEEVLDSRYLVVKRLGRYVPQTPGVIGGAILADGSVAGVVDVRELLRQRSEGLPAMRQRADGPVVDRSRALPLVLVVDDSVSARRTLSELVADAGYRAATAVDGLAALSSIDQEKPAAILTDMEMPRMNGLELAAHLRADRATSAIPLLMITSRSTEKHRRQAETAGVDRYFTKPYQEDAVVEALNSVIASAARD